MYINPLYYHQIAHADQMLDGQAKFFCFKKKEKFELFDANFQTFENVRSHMDRLLFKAADTLFSTR